MAELDEAIAKRSMPYSLEAEQTVIASMVMDAEAINVVSEMLCGDDFYTKQYGIIFETIVELHASGKAVDIVTLQSK